MLQPKWLVFPHSVADAQLQDTPQGTERIDGWSFHADTGFNTWVSQYPILLIKND